MSKKPNPKVAVPLFDPRFTIPLEETRKAWEEYVLRHAQEAELNRALEDFDQQINAMYDREWHERTTTQGVERAYDPYVDAN